MFEIIAHPSFRERNLSFGYVEASFPEPDTWDTEAFARLAEEELAALRREMADYDRKTVFGESPYIRYFKKYKKTYPVMQQLESYLLKGRPFPLDNPINAVTFLTELRTRMLLGTHDIDRMRGTVELFCPEEKLPFPGMRGEEVHTYPGDVSGRDDGGIILSMISGADERTCLRPDSRHISFLFFGAPGVTEEQISQVQAQLIRYAETLVPGISLRPAMVE